MALVDPNIAMSYRGIEVPNQLAQYGQMQQIQAAQRQNRLADAQMAEYERSRAEEEGLRNYLSSADLANPETRAELNKRFGKTGLAYGKALAEQETAALTQQKTRFEVQETKRKAISQGLRDISQNSSYENITAYQQDLAASSFFDPAEKTYWTSFLDRVKSLPIDQRPAALASIGASPGELKPGTIQINQGGQTTVAQVPAFGGAPKDVGIYADVAPPQDVIDARARVAAAGRQEGARVYLPPQPKAEQEARGALLVKQYGAISDQAGIAAKTLPAIQSNLKILNDGFNTGFTAATQAAAAKVLGALGVKDAEKYATDAQIFTANATQAVLQRQLEQKGPQTESDAQRIKETGAQMGNTAEANRFLLTIAQEQLKRDVEQRSFYDKWWKANKTYDGAEDAWYEGDGGKSLFDRPALRKYVSGAVPDGAAARIPGQSSAPSAIPQEAINALKAGVGTDAQFDAIFGAGAARQARGR